MQTKDYAKAISDGIVTGLKVSLIFLAGLLVTLALSGATINCPWR